MQTTINATTRGFGFNRLGTTLLAFGFAAGIAIGAVGGAVIETLLSIRTSEQAIVLPMAHTSVNQGEGLLGGTTAVTAAVRAYTPDHQGEGLLGGTGAVTDQVVAHPSLGQGEGILGGFGSSAIVRPPVKAYDSVGAGEGWLGYGRP